ncbi:phosphatidylserine/phosphatidylglycerophosphate/cardiolipin synthase family protein [Chlamydia trachomatis]|uniref:phosphatidylserine/phosphatidylglycerophosphate/ cardiolipin synthase family protein n=1 Tax=Chlamydia trachomatis TaxID=813 RepID=UPI0028E0A3B8|nr:phosphatidylserine/phosphatidylglycerophosphate/cardiolipin synthase family protein [Chlamydia trachomatis]
METTPSNISPCFNLHGEAIQLFSTESGPSPLRAILQAIKQAKYHIYIQIYRFTSEEIAAALLERANNGVRIHYNINTSAAQKPLFDILTCKFKATNQARLHCKNIVVDGSLVITGSANFSDAAFSRDINLVAIIRNPSLGQLVVSQQSGWITGGSQQIEYCSLYCHNHQGVDEVVKAVQSAVKTIRVAMLVLSHEEVLHALHQAAQRGVEVTVLVNPHNKAILFYALQDLNSKVKLRDVVVEENALLHCKVGLIDTNLLITGSANWTVRGLQYNIEDLIFIHQPTPSQLSAFFNLWEQAMSLSREVTAKKIKKSARAQHKYDDE